MKTEDRVWGIVLLLVLVYAIYSSSTASCDAESIPGYGKAIFKTDEEPAVNIKVASTPAERAKGLMNVSYMPADEGMLFTFPKQTNTFFWMKDTVIPLDIMFVKNDTIMYIAHSAPPCEVDQCPTFGPGQYYDYVVETNAGYARKHGIDIGVAVELD